MRRTRSAPSGRHVRRSRRRADRGATGLEYGLLIAGTSVVAMLGLSTLGQSTADNLSCFTQKFDDPASTTACAGAAGAGDGQTPVGPGPDPVQTTRAPTPTESPTGTATGTATATASPTGTATASPTGTASPTP